jgi:hypothetical protein
VISLAVLVSSVLLLHVDQLLGRQNEARTVDRLFVLDVVVDGASALLGLLIGG